ncbi:hypothetical protein [Candidatus Mesenet endosymbiont of Phosphuga atrata]|uniref:hypothetical protein n=1 Tax=Candidatus Mesenet endosymbiont of Phosphuga atrata TaxID=3066221 RepID=UPI0030D08E85
MTNNKPLKENDKKKLANFLFQCLSDGVSKERINNLARIWIKKGGEVSDEECAATWDECRDKELGREMACSLIVSTLPLAILFGLMAGCSVGRGEKAVTVMGIFAGLAAVGFLASVGYLINQYVGDKEYASACAEEMVDAYNVKCYEELKNVVQDQQDLIGTILNYKTSVGSNLYPNLPLSDDQLTQFVLVKRCD